MEGELVVDEGVEARRRRRQIRNRKRMGWIKGKRGGRIFCEELGGNEGKRRRGKCRSE